MEVYIDNMVVKSVDAANHVKDLEEVFNILQFYNMKLNPSKCNFAVSSGKFLGHMVTRKGIEASPNQIAVVINLTSPTTTKEVQNLTGWVAALNIFISRSSDRRKLFYDVLQKNKGFDWTKKHEEALSELKEYLTTAPLLSKPLPGEMMYVYLLGMEHVVSGVLTLADFVAEFSPSLLSGADQELQQLVSKADVEPWTLYTDGASNINGTGLGLVLKSPQGDIMAYSICCEFKATNNGSEYEALIIGLTTAIDLKINHICINYDSLLIVNHVKGIYEAKDEKMIAYLRIVRELQHKFTTFSIQQIPRELNTQVDALAGLGAVFRHENLTNIPIIHILKTIKDREEVKQEIMAIESDPTSGKEDWLEKYINYLTQGIFPVDNNKARAFKMKASRFVMLDDVLFKKFVTGLLQRCLNKEEARQVLKDIHEGECGIIMGEETCPVKSCAWVITGRHSRRMHWTT
ncbi:uncharacterized protein LOC141690511 [Apium graveolens]|uniref:uncharacterized protein LOC141690511 n=1 Tax=Apium graveolens TaxID=4045 RepID=UPI003D7C0659